MRDSTGRRRTTTPVRLRPQECPTERSAIGAKDSGIHPSRARAPYFGAVRESPSLLLWVSFARSDSGSPRVVDTARATAASKISRKKPRTAGAACILMRRRGRESNAPPNPSSTRAHSLTELPDGCSAERRSSPISRIERPSSDGRVRCRRPHQFRGGDGVVRRCSRF